MGIIETLRTQATNGIRAIDDDVRNNMLSGAREIERLQAELAAANTTITNLAERGNAWRHDAEQSQAREVKLRAALQHYAGLAGDDSFNNYLAVVALNLPHDDSALRERLKAERERCAKVCDDIDVERTEYCMNLYEEGERYKADAIAAIRAMED